MLRRVLAQSGLILAVVVLTTVYQPIALVPALPMLAQQGDCQIFQQTGKQVCGRFLQYWQQHGGLAQQGLPLSNEFVEVSELNGRSYTVQYFERAVFEKHPENQPPYDVLLSLLGTFQFERKYPNGDPSVLPAHGATGTVKATGSMSIARSCHSTTLLADGKVLIAGGMVREGTFLASAELYDPIKETFSPTGSMADKRVCHRATSLPDGKVLVMGGFGDGYLASAELYNPSTSKFSATGSMSAKRDGFTATLLKDGSVLITGGYDGQMLSGAERYYPGSGTFRPAGNMTTPRSAHTATLLPNGKVLIVGGGGKGSVLSSAELYDPSSNSFTSTGSMAVPRYKHGASLVAGGNVLVVGGSDNRDWRGRYASTELYNIVNGTFTAAGSMSVGRFKLPDALALLKDGRLVVAGGNEHVEIYNPATGSFGVASGQLDAGRFYSTATSLLDGRVLIAGGYDLDIAATAQAWVYAP